MTDVFVKRRQGFASMDPEKLRQISRKGGTIAQQRGSAHRWTSEGARSAGRKGGRAKRHQPEVDVEMLVVAGRAKRHQPEVDVEMNQLVAANDAPPSIAEQAEPL